MTETGASDEVVEIERAALDGPRGYQTCPRGRVISLAFGKPAVLARHPWPDDVFLQGGHEGLVVRREGGTYLTAFVEADSPALGFLRGEGTDIACAEDACWAKAERVLACPGHEYEPRGYRNGAGFCRHCQRFASGVFTAEQLGMFCCVCGTASNAAYDAEHVWCPEHIPHRAELSFCMCALCLARDAAVAGAQQRAPLLP